MSKLSLTDEQVEQYRTESYLVIPSVFDRTELDNVDQVIRDLTREAVNSGEPDKVMELEPDPIDGERVPRRIYNPFDQHEWFRKMATDARILDRIVSLIGPDIGFHHSKLNMKPAKVGSVVEWHQDLAYFPHTNDDLVTTLIYLDDATENNGCLQVLPRHHTHFFDHRLPDGVFAGMITENINDGRFGQPVSLPAPSGSVIFMHAMAPHSSLPNRSERPRRTLIFEYRAADSWPIFYGQYMAELERHTYHLLGKPARFARLAGPPPMIPRMPDGPGKSLYKLQAEAKVQAPQLNAAARSSNS